MAPRFDAALSDVSKAYKSPHDVSADSALTKEQKTKLLKQWEYDLRELQVAADENMTGESTGRNAELLTQVRGCLHDLGAEDDLEKAAPSKQGG